MLNKIKKIFNKKNQKQFLVFFVILFFVFIVFSNVSLAVDADDTLTGKKIGDAAIGGVGTAIQLVVGWIAFLIVSVLSLITTVLINLLVSVAKFSDIIDVPIVIQGWVIIRDLCNMFFVLALLIIAFATILKIENYSAKKLLPKLLVMAVAINFSRTIFGLLVDASQIVMLTFVGGFAEGGGHLVALFNMDKFLTADFSGAAITAGEGLGPWRTTISILAAVFAAIMTLVVVSVILAVLVMRIVFLWIYTMLSPLAFLGFAFPPIQGYTKQIWEDFVKQLVVGPVLAFFLWLALTAASKSSEALGSIGKEGSNLCAGDSSFFCNNDLQVYILTVGLLLGGLRFAQQMGGDVAKVAGKAEGWSKKGIRFGGAKTWGATKAVGTGVGAVSQMFAPGRAVKGFVQKAGFTKENLGKGAATGAAVGSLLGPVGTIAGGFLGGLLGAPAFKQYSDRTTNWRKKKEARYKASQKPDKGAKLDENGKATDKEQDVAVEWNDKSGRYEYIKDIGDKKKGHVYQDKNGHNVGRWGDVEHDGKKYRRIDESGAYGVIDSEGKYLNGYGLVTSDPDNIDKAKFKAMSENEATRWAGYSSVKYKGWGAKDAVVDEKVDKIANEYKGQSNELLRQLLDLEKNETKLMGISLALGLKKGFSDGAKGIKEVMKAKKNLSGNGLLLKKVNDSMNKNHMVLNNSKIETVNGKEKVVLDEGSIAKLVSSGGANWKDQAWATHNEQSLKLMSKQLGVGFEKEFTASMKTDKDRDTAKKTISKFVEELDFKPPESSIRKAFATSTGEFLKAYNDNNGLNKDELGKMMSKISKASVYADVDKDVRSEEDFQKAFADNVNVNMMVKISGSPDIDKSTMEQYAWMVKEHNPDLYDKMKNDNKLAALMDDVKNKSKSEIFSS